MKKIVSFLLAVILIVQLIPAYASSTDMSFDGVSYLQTTNQPVTYKGNIWRTGTQQSNVILPLREQWNTQVGAASSQPIASGEYIYVLAENKLKQISTVTQKVTGSITIQTTMTPSKTHITLVKNGDGWFNPDKVDRLLFGTQEGYAYCVKIGSDDMDSSWVDWKYKASSSAISSNPMFSFDAVTEEPYVIFGSEDKKLYVLSSSGQKVTDIKENGGKFTAPVLYHLNNNQVYSQFLYGVDTGTKGYISSGFINSGSYIENPMLNKDVTDSYGIKGIAGLTTEVVEIGGIRESMIVVVDKNGAVFCISLRTGDLLWKYIGAANSTITSVPVIDDEYVYITASNYKGTGKAKFIAIDYRKAIDIGSNNPNADISEAVAFQSNDSEFTGISDTSANIIRIAETNEQGNTDIRGKIAVVADKGSKDNLRIFYTDQTDDNKAKRVTDAFQVLNPTTKNYETTDSLTLPKGVQAEMLYAFNTLYVIDGNGVMHAFEGMKENNLALLNMQNSSLNVQAGKEYEITANIANYIGTDTKPIDIQFTLVTDSGEKYPINKNDIVIPSDGSTIHLSYTVPNNYTGKYFSVRCEVNSDDKNGDRKVIESNYNDNIQELRIEVAGKIDLFVSKIPTSKYKEKMFVTIPFEFKNNSDYDVQDVPISIYIDGDKLGTPQVPKTIDLTKHSSHVVNVKWYTGDISSNIKHLIIKAVIDEELKYTDDSITRNAVGIITITKDIPDFEVVSISPANYVQHSRVLTNIIVRNNSGTDYVDDKKVKFSFSINGSTATQEVDLKKFSELQITKTWNSPSAGTEVTLAAEINPSHNPVETDYTNNKKSIIANIVKTDIHEVYYDYPVVPIVPPPSGCTNSHRTWTEDRFDHWGSRKVGTRTEVTIDPKTKKETTKTIDIYESYAVYKTYSFYADLGISSSVSQSKMKSGYGFECTVTTTMSTNYDNPASVVGPQMLVAYFPETQYGTPIALDPINALGSYSNTWHFYINTKSVKNAKNHYVPVWFPDGKNYTVMFVASYGQSPGGALCATDKSSILINGSMYEDDYSGGGK